MSMMFWGAAAAAAVAGPPGIVISNRTIYSIADDYFCPNGQAFIRLQKNTGQLQQYYYTYCTLTSWTNITGEAKTADFPTPWDDYLAWMTVTEVSQSGTAHRTGTLGTFSPYDRTQAELQFGISKSGATGVANWVLDITISHVAGEFDPTIIAEDTGRITLEVEIVPGI